MSTSELLIRPFRPSDTVEIIQLFREVVHTVGARYYSQEQVAAWAPIENWTDDEIEADRQRWQKNLEANITLVAEIDSIMVGFADMAKTGYLDHMYVRKEYQTRGVGYRLFKELEKTAREIGLSKITTHASVMAMPLAKRMGFVVIQKEIIQRKGVELTRYEMEKLF
jgi:putative acetyltransferase